MEQHRHCLEFSVATQLWETLIRNDSSHQEHVHCHSPHCNMTKAPHPETRYRVLSLDGDQQNHSTKQTREERVIPWLITTVERQHVAVNLGEISPP